VKAIHRKTHWLNTVFSVCILLVLGGVVLLRRDVPTVIIAILFGVYVAGNSFIHAKRDDFKLEVLMEYALLALAVFIVLVSALRAN
jgi:hypothetical protein